MSHLLKVLRLNSNVLKKAVGKGKKKPIPLILEWAVNGDTAPYLVTSTGEVLWIEDPHEGNIIRAAVRQISDPGILFREILEEVFRRGKEDEWGNTQPYTANGLTGAIEHLQSYDFADLEILVSKKTKEHPRAVWLNKDFGFPLKPTSWLPDECAVVVPKDRDFVGVLGYLDMKRAAAVVHNASRGIAIAWGT